ncbi:WW domain-containing oxidoreductase [Holothuria leucospilota]|uniref:WW domain-containing oxidoreductase n=1 Tax=Holothuria leucospilota TaxID=206669 RepID=A0A9Q1BS47_HOLLE|nr:WW domain-containing oxidoreductase [Holothuria leucospilota]
MGGKPSVPEERIPPERTFIVTGGNTGIGYETAKKIAQLGGRVIIACRSEERATDNTTVKTDAMPDLNVKYMNLDLASLESTATFARQYKESGLPIHVLICNAGLGVNRKRTLQGHVGQLTVGGQPNGGRAKGPRKVFFDVLKFFGSVDPARGATTSLIAALDPMYDGKTALYFTDGKPRSSNALSGSKNHRSLVSNIVSGCKMGAKPSVPEERIPAERTFIVTGGNTAQLGGRVIIACRSEERAQNAIRKMKTDTISEFAKSKEKEGGDNGENLPELNVQYMHIDLSSLESTIEFARQFKEAGLPLHVLICNAGVAVTKKIGENTVSGSRTSLIAALEPKYNDKTAIYFSDGKPKASTSLSRNAVKQEILWKYSLQCLRSKLNDVILQQIGEKLEDIQPLDNDA